MTSITYPNNIANGDVPDWDKVQAYFDAIVTALETTGLDDNNIKAAAGIARSKLTLTNGIATADIQAGAVTPAKIALGSVGSSSSVAAPNLTPSTWSNSGASLTAASSGTYIVTCNGAITNDIGGSTSTPPTIGSRLLKNLTPFQALTYKVAAFTTGGDYSWPFSHFDIVSLAATDAVVHQVYSSVVGSDVAANGFGMKMIRISS